jgi:hypothetical protein
VEPNLCRKSHANIEAGERKFTDSKYSEDPDISIQKRTLLGEKKRLMRNLKGL